MKAELLLFYCQRRTPVCSGMPQRKLLCFYKPEAFRGEKNPFIQSFYYFHLQTREIEIDDWKARLVGQRFSEKSQLSVSSFRCFHRLHAVGGGVQNPKKAPVTFALQYNVMSCTATLCSVTLS